MTKPLGQLIALRVPLDEQTLERAVEAARRGGHRLGEYLIESQNFSEEVVYRALAEQFGLQFYPSIEGEIDRELVRDLPTELLREGQCLPLVSEGTTLRLAMSNPLDLDTVLAVSAVAGLPVQTIVTTPSEMSRNRERYFSGESLLKQSVGRIADEYRKRTQSEEIDLSLEDVRKSSESEPVVKLVSLIFDEAIRQRASDIHIEPTGDNAVVRYRIDGLLTQHMELAYRMYLPVTSRVKILADLDIAEKRVPQDGRIRYRTRGQEYDFRVSTLPTHQGEKTVVRILEHDLGLLDIKNLGVPQRDLRDILELIEKPQGMVFVTGPTGSGKSSTLFACLNRIRTKAINITTIENPVEYKLPGVNQVQINEKAGVTFAATLRSILRQDPDVILIGEIRDGETAQIATQASQTGHLVFSTLHTNDAVSAITRLRDLGVPGFLISSSLLAILAQRLVRVLCPVCKEQGPPTEEIRTRWSLLMGGIALPASYRARGCTSCNGTGYRGRTGIFELVRVNETLRELIADNASEARIRQQLREAGMTTLIMDGIGKIEAGITTAEEILRVVVVEDVAGMRGSNGSEQETSGS